MTDALTRPLAARAEAKAVPGLRIRRAGRIVIVGAALGVLGQLLFYGVGIGINLVLIIGAMLLASMRLRDRGARASLEDAWLGPAALVLAAFAALRGDATLVAIDALASLGLGAAASVALGGGRVVRRPAASLAWLAGQLLAATLIFGPRAAADARSTMPTAIGARSRVAGVVPVLRGALIALPLVIIFTTLFASADPAFARIVDGLLGLEPDLGELPGRIVVALAIGWLAVGALAFSVGSPPAPDAAVEMPRRLGSVEAVTVLLTLVAIFGVFVALQAAYLFGGLDTLAATGLTYAEYARRGFFELCAVALLVGAIILAMESLVLRRSPLYVAAASGLAVLTAVVIVSAALRLGLYQQAYGWTELRFYVAATIAWLAVGAAMTLAAVVLNRSRWLPHGLLLGALAVGIVINVIGPVRFIAAENVSRAADPSLVPTEGRTGLDDAYLYSLDADAIEPLLDALPRLEGDEREAVEAVLDVWRRAFRSTEPDAWQAWNLGRANARELLVDDP